MSQERVPVRKQKPEERIKNFNEVCYGYNEKEAVAESTRCLQCKKAPCVKGCPVEINIPGFIKEIKGKDFKKSIAVLKDKNCLPAMCGRVCPQESQCEAHCVLGKKGQPVDIGKLERFVADLALFHNGSRKDNIATPSPETGAKKVAVIGSGPAGLTCASELTKAGVQVTIFESLHLPGGVLSYGIPEFRLPKEVVSLEIAYLKDLGAEIVTDVIVGKTLTIEDLFERGYSAIFIGAGAGLPSFMNIPGENLLRVYSSNEFLTRVNLMKSFRFPEHDTPINLGEKVAVIGGGNVAMDSARSALRLGAKKVTVLYRRTEAEMPARREEYENAVEEGIEFHFLVTPLEVIGNEKGYVSGIRIIKNELGEPDASGRRRPVPIPGSETVIPLDTVIVAIGQSPNPLLTKSYPQLKTTRHGTIVADPETGATDIPGIYAGGDITTGAATVISAMGAGKKSARAILEYLKTLK